MNKEIYKIIAMILITIQTVILIGFLINGVEFIIICIIKRLKIKKIKINILNIPVNVNYGEMIKIKEDNLQNHIYIGNYQISCCKIYYGFINCIDLKNCIISEIIKYMIKGTSLYVWIKKGDINNERKN